MVFPGVSARSTSLYEALTLIQTGVIRYFPIVLVEVTIGRPSHVCGAICCSASDRPRRPAARLLTDDPNVAVDTVIAYERTCDHAIDEHEAVGE